MANTRKSTAPKMESTRKSKKKSSKINMLFSSPKGNNKRFSTSFNLGDYWVDIKSVVSQGIVKLNFKIEKDEFSFAGALTMSQSSLEELQELLYHLLSNVSKKVM